MVGRRAWCALLLGQDLDLHLRLEEVDRTLDEADDGARHHPGQEVAQRRQTLYAQRSRHPRLRLSERWRSIRNKERMVINK